MTTEKKIKEIKANYPNSWSAWLNPYQMSCLIGSGSFKRGESLYHTWDFKISQDEVIEMFVNRSITSNEFGNTNYGFPCSIAGWILHEKYNPGDYTARTTALFRKSTKGWILIALRDRGANKTITDIISDGMRAINGVAPQQAAKGFWVNPKKDAKSSGFIAVDSIKIGNFKTNN